MNSNTNDPSGALADGLTLIRIALTPLIIFVIIMAWSQKPDDPNGYVSLDLGLVLLASILFVIAAITDILDDIIGGSANTNRRLYGWMDDIADSVLVVGTLGALLWVTHKAGLLHWTFALPAGALIWRDIGLALFKGRQMRKEGFLETRLGDIKNALVMLATCTLVAAPWLSNWLQGVRAGNDPQKIAQIYDAATPWVWNFGLGLLWIGAFLALLTGVRILRTRPTTHTTGS